MALSSLKHTGTLTGKGALTWVGGTLYGVHTVTGQWHTLGFGVLSRRDAERKSPRSRPTFPEGGAGAGAVKNGLTPDSGSE